MTRSWPLLFVALAVTTVACDQLFGIQGHELAADAGKSPAEGGGSSGSSSGSSSGTASSSGSITDSGSSSGAADSGSSSGSASSSGSSGGDACTPCVLGSSTALLGTCCLAGDGG